MFIVFCLGLVTLFVQFHPRYLSHAWNTYRMLLYSSLAAYGVIPSIHWVYLSGGLSAAVVQVNVITSRLYMSSPLDYTCRFHLQ